MAEQSATATEAPKARKSWWKTALKLVGGLFFLLVLAAAYLWFFQRPSHSAPAEAPVAVKPSGDKVLDGIRRAIEFLRVRQEASGEFSKGLLDPKPGFTAAVVDSIVRSPDHPREATHPFLKKAALAIIKHQQPDGAIATPAFALDTYTTAMSVMALTGLENPAYAETLQKAKQYLLSVQYHDDESNLSSGAAGYTPGGRTSGDLTGIWVEALKTAGVKEGDPAFKNAEKFFTRLQNNSETNTEPAPGTEVGNDGGFIYRPGESKPKDVLHNGKRIPQSYGLMSYAGLKSFLYMDIKKSDPRVASAYKWVKHNYTLDENRNIGADGLYYYYMTMAKALSLYGEKEIQTADGQVHNWAQELSDRLVATQHEDGSWLNTASNRWSEDDAVLVTSYCIRTLTLCHEVLHKPDESAATAKEAGNDAGK